MILLIYITRINYLIKFYYQARKGIGKCTFAYHLINYVLSKDEDYSYDFKNNKIKSENKSFKLIQNGFIQTLF